MGMESAIGMGSTIGMGVYHGNRVHYGCVGFTMACTKSRHAKRASDPKQATMSQT